MATPPQLTQIAFAGGIDESVEDEIIEANASFRTLQNIRQDRRGGASKRLGFAPLTRARLDATTRTSGRRMLERNGTPVVLDSSSTIDEYSQQATVNVNHGRVPECSVSAQPIATRVTNLNFGTLDNLCDIGYANGYFAVAQQNSRTGYLTVVDVNGVTIRSPELVFATNDVFVGLGSYSTYLIAVGVSTGSANIAAYYLDTTSAATINTGWVSIGNIATDHHSGGGLGNPDSYFDTHSLSDRVAIVYRNTSAGASRLTVASFNVGGALQTTTINTSSVTPDNVAIYATSTSALWVGWNESSSVKICGLTPTTLSVVLSTTGTIMTLDTSGAGSMSFMGIVWFDGSSAGRVIATEGGNDRSQMRAFNTTAGATASVGAQNRVPVAQLAGKPFVYNARAYAVFDAYSGVQTAPLYGRQGLCVLCDWTADQTWIRPIAVNEPYLSIPATIPIAHCVSPTATTFATPMAIVRNGDAAATSIVTYDFASNTKRSSVTHEDAFYLGDGILATYDGVLCVEAGFVQRPPKPTEAHGSVGLINGTVSYVITYENVDADGRLAISSVSDPVTVTGLVNKQVDVSFRPCAITNRQVTSYGGEIRQRIWRSDNAGPYYLLTSYYNITASVFTTYSDNTATIASLGSALLMGTGRLPGTGAQLDRRSPPALQNITSFNGMLVGSHDSRVFYSSQPVEGEEPWFSPIFYVSVPENVIALCVQDGSLYIFGQRNIYITSGDAPSDNGLQGGLGTVRVVATDAGCKSAAGILPTGKGIFFQSDRGIEILGRGGVTDWIGEPVQVTTGLYPIITSAVLDVRNALARFTLAPSIALGVAASPGVSVVYDLTLNIWTSVDVVRGQSASESAQDAAYLKVAGVWRYAWLGQDGYVYVEALDSDATAYLDGSAWITRIAESANFRSSGLQGRQVFNKVLFMERKSTDHDASIALAYDYSTSFETPTAYSAATINALLADGQPITQLQHAPHDTNDGEATRIRIQDATPTSGTVGSGKASTWLGLTLDITPKQGPFEVPEAAT